MGEDYLYLKIAASIRRDLANGMYKPGDTLPPIRSFAESWHCTIGTVQHAMQTLASEGMVSTHIGKGTKVIGPITLLADDPLRRANLVHRAETYLLEVMTSGYTTVEVEDSFRIALDRWRKISSPNEGVNQKTLRFAGSHDLAVAWLATHFSEFAPGYQLHLTFSGSLTGLMSLLEGKADIVGSHLWDDESETYNIPFIHNLFPGEKLALITLANRRIGFMVKRGNPKNIRSIEDLTRPEIRFVNRSAGSGTRVYFDSLLRKKKIQPEAVQGYANQKSTHSEIAAEVAEDHADVGIGLEAAAKSYNLEFVFLTMERYDLVMKQDIFDLAPIQAMISWLKGNEFHQLLEHLGGYEHGESGQVIWS